MEERYNESTINRPEGDRLLDAPLITIDLLAHKEQLKTEAGWQKNDRNAITLFKTKGMRIVLIAMHLNAEIAPQIIESIISVQVLEGHLKFITEEQTADIKTGQMLTLHAQIEHTVKAMEETTFLLTLTEENYQESAYKLFAI